MCTFPKMIKWIHKDSSKKKQTYFPKVAFKANLKITLSQSVTVSAGFHSKTFHSYWSLHLCYCWGANVCCFHKVLPPCNTASFSITSTRFAKEVMSWCSWTSTLLLISANSWKSAQENPRLVMEDIFLMHFIVTIVFVFLFSFTTLLWFPCICLFTGLRFNFGLLYFGSYLYILCFFSVASTG